MTKLSPKEVDLLERIDKKEGLRPYFFRKAKGLKWFDELFKRKYFEPDKNPKPEEGSEEGYVWIPFWQATEYLVKTAPELESQEDNEYARRFLEILVSATKYAQENEFTNYKTWFQFSQIIRRIPSEIISEQDLDIVDYWLDDPNGNDLIIEEIGENWLPSLLQSENSYEQQLILRLLEFIYKISFVDRTILNHTSRDAVMRVDRYYAQKINDKVAILAGQFIGRDALKIFDAQLRQILDELDNDSWSALWQPAIESHEQNQYHDDAENILMEAYRDSLAGYINSMPDEAFDYVSEMLKGDYETVKRLAIHIINENFQTCRKLIDPLIDEEYFTSNYRHEIWRLLNHNYGNFSKEQKGKVLKVISKIARTDDQGNKLNAATAYNQACWLTSIKDFGAKENDLYKNKVEMAGVEPDHPSFSSFTTSKLAIPRSSIPLDELRGLDVAALPETLGSYQIEPSEFGKPSTQGVLRELIKESPLKFYSQLSSFVEMDLAYVDEVIEAYRGLWRGNEKLPWDDIWASLLDFCSTVIHRKNFWDDECTENANVSVTGRSSVISSIACLIEEGTKSDDHAFNSEHLPDAEEIVLFLLNNESGQKFNVENDDAVSNAINSPRGQSLEALINITLRRCRLADRTPKKDHSATWKHFQQYYEMEFDRASIPEYEFVTLVTSYLPNFLYMSKNWTLGNLDKIFDRSDNTWWRCAMQGYAHAGIVYKELYSYLKDEHLIRALNDEYLCGHIGESIVRNIGTAYVSGLEKFSDENSQIKILISRGKHEELGQLIRFLWSMGAQGNQNIKQNIYELWPKIHECVDTSTPEGRKLASELCLWIVFVEKIDSEVRDLLYAIAPYAHVEHNSYEMLENLAAISKTQPFEVHSIWMKLLEGSTPDYPEKAIQEMLSNLVKEGSEGLQKANDAVDIYLRIPNTKPRNWLREIENKQS